jgi:photosystem II stability/assembly factor-like uncharacterized protein
MIRIPYVTRSREPRTGPTAPLARLAGALAFLLFTAAIAFSQQLDPSLYSGMRWRLIGPYRAGRVTAVAGIEGNPAVYYMGTPGGGVWKTTDGGTTWKPIFDDARVASIGALALAPSNPQIIYVGTGEQTEGNGVYKSTDSGATWINVGLRETKYITSVLVDPRDPNVVFVGARGAAEKSPDRGVFKSTDGGKTWIKVLYKDDVTGPVDLEMDPGNPRVLYAALWHYRFRPGSTESKEKEVDSQIYKSTDGGATWKALSGNGLPASGKGRIGIAVAPGDHGRRLYAIVTQGLFRSDNAGETWRRITTDPRVIGNYYFSRVFVDPNNPDIVYVMQTSMYRSTDGGRTFIAFKGAPGGDDYHVLWTDPKNSQRMILGVDQGAIISLDGGKSWSTWYNQPTGQFYHVSTDNGFPYIAYAAQQDSGTAAVPSRSDWGEISYRDWFSTGGFEYCYIAPDPADTNIVYSGGWFGTVVRYDRTTGQITHVFIPDSNYRTAAIAPLVFSPQDPHMLYFGTQYLLKTANQGKSWQIMSPDLTIRPAAPGGAKAGNGEADEDQGVSRRTAISSLAPSPLEAGEIWAGTDDGLIHLTQDSGKTWQNVTPSDLSPKSDVLILEASHFDRGTAFAAVGVPRDSHPYAYRTRDGGKTWTRIIAGLPEDAIVRAVREDPVRKGLLYAGTETGVFVSFDEGDHWQSLQLNLPTSSVRDLAVHGDDLVAATYGRALWILDDLSPLRQASRQIADSNAYLLRPATAIRVRWDNDQETPLPAEVPAGKNPPDGAILNYFLKSVPSGEISVEIRDAQGKLVRRFTSKAPPPDMTLANVPDYWFAPPAVLPKDAGLNRFAWDLRYDPPPALQYSYYGKALDYFEFTLSDHAIPGESPRRLPLGQLVAPGQYELVFTGNDVMMRQPLTVTLDPRVHVPQADLVEQVNEEKRIASGMAASFDAYQAADSLLVALADRQKSLAANADAKDANDAMKDLAAKIDAVVEGSDAAPGIGPLNRDLSRIFWMVGNGDGAPTQSARAAVEESCAVLAKDLAEWRELNSQALPRVNSLLEKYRLPPLPAVTGNSVTPPVACSP